jgi:hypothetical protein
MVSGISEKSATGKVYGEEGSRNRVQEEYLLDSKAGGQEGQFLDSRTGGEEGHFLDSRTVVQEGRLIDFRNGRPENNLLDSETGAQEGHFLSRHFLDSGTGRQSGWPLNLASGSQMALAYSKKARNYLYCSTLVLIRMKIIDEYYF